jgi:hypothetical protein
VKALTSEPIYLSPPQAPSEEHDRPDDARDLIERLAGEAARQSRVERKEAKSRDPVTRILLGLTIAASLIAAATMCYGIYYFPDAPIRQTAEGFVGKGGSARTGEDFEAFLRWKKVMLFVVPSVFVFGVAFGITEARQRRKDAG